MQYLLLIYEDERNHAGLAPGELTGKHMAFGRDNGAALRGGAGLKPVAAATTVRAGRGQPTIHDGPFAETKEQLGGYYMVDVPDLDAAIAIARKIPFAKDGAVEIRPLLAMG
jgi:hypothetical protein